jgi:hypothetical protein
VLACGVLLAKEKLGKPQPQPVPADSVEAEAGDAGKGGQRESEEDRKAREELEELRREKELQRLQLIELLQWEIEELLAEAKEFQVQRQRADLRTHPKP